MATDEPEVWGRWAAPGEHDGRDDQASDPTPEIPDYSNIPRDSTRVPLAHRIQLKFDRFSGFINEYVSNISPGGIFIRTDSPEVPGQLLEFEFRLGDGFELIRGRGEVVWAREHGEGPERLAGMGVRFLELSPGSKDLIYKIVDDYIAHGGKPFDLNSPAAPPPGAAGGAGPPASQPALPWAVELPAIQPLPGVPAITPVSPLERLGAGDSGRAAAAVEAHPLAAAAHDATGTPGAESAWTGAAAGGLDPLEEMLASLPPLDDLAIDSAVHAPPGSAPPPLPGAAWPYGPSPVLPAGPAPLAPGVGVNQEPAAPAPGAPQLFSSFDLRAERRRSRLPLIGLLLAVALLGLGIYLARDFLLGLLDPSRGSATAVAAGQPPPVGSRPGRPARRRGPAVVPPDENAPRASRQPPPGNGAAPGALAFRTAPPARPGSAAAGAPSTPGSAGTAGGGVGEGSAGAGGSGGSAERTAAGTPAVPGAGQPPGGTTAGNALSAAGPTAGAAAGPGGGSTAPPLVSARPSSAAAAAEAARPGAAEPTVGGAPASPGGAEAAGTAPRLTVLERITFEASRGGTDVVLWGNGEFPPSSYTRSRVGGIGGLPVREVVRLIGITRPFAPQQLAVRSAEVAQIRTGYHKPQELHVVMDLSDREVRVTGVETGPHQLRLHLAQAPK